MPEPRDDDFLSGSSGTVTSRRAALRDILLDAQLAVRGVPRKLAEAAGDEPPRRAVLVLGVERTDTPNLMAATRAELERSRHDVSVHTAPAEGRGRWENLTRLLAEHPATSADWLVLVDDDVRLPRGFLDRFLFLAERFELRIAQPAHRRRSNTAWEVTRRDRAGAIARETRFVEQGPLVAFHATTFERLLPFQATGMGWGVDLHWSALAEESGWRIGVIDALPIGHGLRRIATGYSSRTAVEEAREFLRGRPYVRATEAGATLVAHRRW